MNPKTNLNVRPQTLTATVKQACVGSCQRVLAQVQRAKAAMLAEAQSALGAPERLLRLALNEAEAIAWETPYPHLVFPVLAAEKVRAVETWNRRQQALRAAA